MKHPWTCPRALPVLAAIAAVWCPVGAQAFEPVQYRPGLPPVVEPAPAAAPRGSGDVARQRFQQQYESAGRPRIALFWNVELIDSIEDRTVRVDRIQGGSRSRSSGSAQSTSGLVGQGAMRESSSETQVNVVRSQSTERLSDNPRRSSSLAERDMWQAETGFTWVMRSTGVRLVDRNTIIRTAAARDGTGGSTRTIEMKALLGKADLLMEVLLTPDPKAPLGWGFRVDLKHIDSGEIRMSMYAEALPADLPPPRVSYRASPQGGYERVVETPRIGVDEIGRALGEQVMGMISQQQGLR